MTLTQTDINKSLIRLIFALELMLILCGCTTPSTVALASETVSPTTIVPTITNPAATNTPSPIKRANTNSATSTAQATATNEVGDDRWFPMPKISLPRTLSTVSARAYKGIRIPPLPDDIVVEFKTSQPYGEVPAGTIFYQLLLVRKNNARMLWLGIPFNERTQCCGKSKCCGGETPYRIYDSIPLTPVHDNDLLIPFVCSQNGTPDIFLIVIAERPEPGANATNIHDAWRIDQETTTLKAVSTQGIVCLLNW